MKFSNFDIKLAYGTKLLNHAEPSTSYNKIRRMNQGVYY